MQALIGAGGAAAGPIGAIVGGILSVIGALIGLGGSGVSGVAQAVRVLAAATASGLKHIIEAIKWLGKGGLSGFLQRLRRIIDVIRDRLQRVLDPIIRALRRYRDWIDRIYMRYVIPVLDMLQRIRGALVVFRLLHMKWAEKLDREMLLLQRRINEPFQVIRARLNEVINWLTLITDPGGILHRSQVLLSAVRSVAGLTAILQRSRLTYPPPSPTPEQVYWSGYLSAEGADARRAALGVGAQDPEEQAALVRIRQAAGLPV